MNRFWETLAFLRRLIVRVPRVPFLWLLCFVVGVVLLTASLHGELGGVDATVAIGTAPPGRAERPVPFNLTSQFQATLVVDRCAVDFYLLSDPEYETFLAQGLLPSGPLNCNRTAETVRAPVAHMITMNSAQDGSNASYEVYVQFLGRRAPYAVLSIPGSAMVLSATLWFALTRMFRETERLLNESRK